MTRRNFERDAHLLSTITKERLALARVETEQGKEVTDPAVRLLKKKVKAATGKLIGSEHSRYRMRSQIWSTSAYLGPPSLWMTINPSDINNPVAQVFAGENIDLDMFISMTGPSSQKRAENIADDPYTGAKFFHFIVTAILETLFNVKVEGNKLKAKMGVLGRVAAYYGAVESQGRGTLHLHILIWLKDVPSADELPGLFENEDFQNRVKEYIQANIRSYLPGLESAQTIQSIPNDKEFTFSRPPNPDLENYEEAIAYDELRLARIEQLHTCKPRRCLVPDKTHRFRCKRHAPFQCSDVDCVLENGEWRSKRLYGYMNAWNPAILVNVRCNNDIKLLTNGRETKNITYYITAYTAKKQGRTYNLSAAIAQGFSNHAKYPDQKYAESVQDRSRLLLFRILHAINREQEYAGPMVISHLMGWGEVIRSHTYGNIFWSSFVSKLLKAFPDISQQAL